MGMVMDRIWVELQANLGGHHASEYDDCQISRSWEVGAVLDQIIHFCFEPVQSMMSEGVFHSVDRDDYEALDSLSSEAVPNTSASLFPSAKEQSIEEEDGEEEDEGHQPATLPTTLTHEEEKQQLAALVQQKSSDSECSRHQEECCESQFLATEQKLALAQVKQLLRKLEHVEVLYSTSRKMGDENSKYRTSQFKRRHDALILWSKITEGLANHLCRLSKWIGVTIRTPYEMQLSFECHLSSSPSQNVSRTSTNGSSVASKRAIFSQSSVSVCSDISSQNPEESLLLTQSSLFSSSSARSQTTLQRLFSQQNPSSLDDVDPLSGYSKFVDRTLKKKGLKWLVDQLAEFSAHVLSMAELAMTSQTSDDDSEREREEENGFRGERKPLLHIYKPQLAAQLKRATSTTPFCWMDEFSAMNLPSFSQLVGLVHD